MLSLEGSSLVALSLVVLAALCLFWAQSLLKAAQHWSDAIDSEDRNKKPLFHRLAGGVLFVLLALFVLQRAVSITSDANREGPAAPPAASDAEESLVKSSPAPPRPQP